MGKRGIPAVTGACALSVVAGLLAAALLQAAPVAHAVRPPLPTSSENVTVSVIDGAESMQEIVSQHKFLFVVFSTTTCGECKKLNKELNETAWVLTKIKGMSHCWVAYVDGNANPELADQFNITKYPTVLYMRDHDPETATEVVIPDSAEEFIGEMREHVGMEAVDTSKLLHDADELVEWLFWRGTSTGQIKPAVVMFLTTGSGDKEQMEVFQAFSSVNKQRRYRKDFRFAQISNAEVAETFGVDPNNSTIMLFKDYDERSEAYDGEVNALALARWLRVRARPTAIAYPVDARVLRKLQAEEKVILNIFVSSAHADDPLLFRRAVPALSDMIRGLESEGGIARGDIVAGLSDGERFRGWLKPFGLTVADLPAVGIYDVIEEAYFRMPGSLQVTQDESAVHPGAEFRGSDQVETWEGPDGFRMAKPAGSIDALALDPIEPFIRAFFDDALTPEVVDLDDDSDDPPPAPPADSPAAADTPEDQLYGGADARDEL